LWAKAVSPTGALVDILNFFTAGELDAGKRVPRPIKVGDRVTWGAGQVRGTVKAIEDDKAWVYCETNGPYDTVRLVSDFVRVSP
jgi:hypothetical protein